MNLNLVYSELKLIFSHDPRAKIFICKGFCTVDTRTLSAVRFHLFHNAQIIVDEKQMKNPLDIQQKISAIKHTKSLHIQGIFLVLNKT